MTDIAILAQVYTQYYAKLCKVLKVFQTFKSLA